MGWFSKCASWLWNGAKRAVAFVWDQVAKPVVAKALSWCGVAPDTIARTFVRVEAAAEMVVAVLETSLGDLVQAALDRLELRTQQWLLERHGRLLGVIGVALTRIRALLGTRHIDQDPVRIVSMAATKRVATMKVRK